MKAERWGLFGVISAAAGLAMGIWAAAGAEVFDDARVAAPFISIGAGARAAAIGGAFCAVADDATAVHWNPGGLGLINRFEAQFTHNQWIEGFRQEFFGVALPVSGTLSFAWTVIDLGEFSELDSSGGATGNIFSVNDQLYTLGYGRGLLRDSLFVGFSGKVVQEDMGDGYIDRSALVDLGAILVPWYSAPGLSLGAVVQNIPMAGSLSGFHVPLTLRAGAAWKKSGVLLAPSIPESYTGGRTPRYVGQIWNPQKSAGDELLLAADMVIPRHGDVEFRAGAEYWWLSVTALRAGYRFTYPSNELGGLSGLTLGLGVRGRGFQVDYGFDYAYAPYGDLGDASRFSLLVAF